MPNEIRSPAVGVQLMLAVGLCAAGGVAVAAVAFGVGEATVWSGLAVIAGLVLATSGVAKLRDPGPATRGLAGIGVRVPSSSLRGVGAAEIALGAATAVIGSLVVCALAALAYVSFAIVATRMWRTDGASSCGCFGDGDAKPGPAHVVVDVVAAATMVGAAATSSGAAVAVVDATPWFGVPALSAAVLAAAAIVALLTVAAETDALADGSIAADRTFRLLEDA